VIVSFGDRATEDIYHGRSATAARRISRDLWERVRTKLDLVNASTSLHDLRVPPPNHLEKLRGDLSEFHSIRVNSQYRLIFRSDAGNCGDVRCTDYH
jgi:proteic killer suppression protein